MCGLIVFSFGRYFLRKYPSNRCSNNERKNNMTVTLNKDVLQGKWKQIRGKVKQQWGRLTDDQLNQISGYYDEVAGLIQEKYGYSREKAQQELDAFIQKMGLHSS